MSPKVSKKQPQTNTFSQQSHNYSVCYTRPLLKLVTAVAEMPNPMQNIRSKKHFQNYSALATDTDRQTRQLIELQGMQLSTTYLLIVELGFSFLKCYTRVGL